jgi:ADP-ribose pyrophosphatase YjhB (NUDIX family)
LAAGGVIFDHQGRLLLIHENYGSRRYNLPGGAVEEGETPWAAVVREVREETTLEVEPEELSGV